MNEGQYKILTAMGCVEDRAHEAAQNSVDCLVIPADMADKLIRKYSRGKEVTDTQFEMIMMKFQLWPLSPVRKAFYRELETSEGKYDREALLVSGILQGTIKGEYAHNQLLFEVKDNLKAETISTADLAQLIHTMLEVAIAIPYRICPKDPALEALNTNLQFCEGRIVQILRRGISITSADFLFRIRDQGWKYFYNAKGLKAILLELLEERRQNGEIPVADLEVAMRKGKSSQRQRLQSRSRSGSKASD